jgi:hypothetical protein
MCTYIHIHMYIYIYICRAPPKHLKNLQQTLEKSILGVETNVFYIFVVSIYLYKKCPKNTPSKGPYIGLYKAM